MAGSNDEAFLDYDGTLEAPDQEPAKWSEGYETRDAWWNTRREDDWPDSDTEEPVGRRRVRLQRPAAASSSGTQRSRSARGSDRTPLVNPGDYQRRPASTPATSRTVRTREQGYGMPYGEQPRQRIEDYMEPDVGPPRPPAHSPPRHL